MTAVTVVVPAHGGADLPARLLAALDGQAAAAGVRLPVVVVDDASPQPLAGALQATTFPALALDVVRTAENGGPGAARNRGVERVRTPWVAFLDSDMLPGPGWLERLLALTDGEATADVVEGLVDTAGHGDVTPFTHATAFSRPGTHHGAGNVVMRVATLRTAGGYDERFFDRRTRVHFREDTELAFRLERAGARFAFDGALVAVHPPLAPSWWGPVRLARRYQFDALLSREHPEAFRRLARVRAVGPLSLRRARHDAAVLFVTGAAGALAARVLRRPLLARAAAASLAAGWAGSALALCWGRRVPPRAAPVVAAVSAVTPWVYLWHYWRGVLRFRHRPRF